MNGERIEALLKQGKSQRAVARELGISPVTVRRHKDLRQIETRHRAGPPASFADEQFTEQAPVAKNWNQLRLALRSEDGSTPSHATLRRAAARLRVDVGHLDDARPGIAIPQRELPIGEVPHRGDAAEFMAAGYYASVGAKVSLTAGGRYDLIADFNGRLVRVQVKYSGAKRRGMMQWCCKTTSQRYNPELVAHANGRREHVLYTEDEIDEFFCVVGDGSLYRIPVQLVTQNEITLPGKFSEFQVSLTW